MKEKATNTICNENLSSPLIYRLSMLSHIVNDFLSFFYNCSSDIIMKFASHTV